MSSGLKEVRAYLGAVGSGTGVGHGQHVWLVVLDLEVLICTLIRNTSAPRLAAKLETLIMSERSTRIRTMRTAPVTTRIRHTTMYTSVVHSGCQAYRRGRTGHLPDFMALPLASAQCLADLTELAQQQADSY
jgi:hypothetical protein